MGVSVRLRELVNSHYSVQDAYGIATGRQCRSHGKVYCCMHPNVNSPAAKIYGSKLVCFGQCGRSYDAYDILSVHAPQLVEDLKSSVVAGRVSGSGEVRVRDFPSFLDLGLDLGLVLDRWLSLV